MADQIQLGKLRGAPAKPGRLAGIDWLRGLACVVMFQAHSYSSWLSPEARKTEFYRWSQAAATVPAPLFIFLAGVSSAMVTQRLREKGVERNAIARTTILRGAEIYGLGLLFRVQEFVLGYPKAPWTDLLPVAVDYAAAAMAAMAPAVLYQRRAHLRAAPAVVVSDLPVGCLRVCGAGHR